MLRVFLLTACAVAALFGAPARAQRVGEVAGRVTAAADGAGVAGATVIVAGTNYGTAAEADGRYRFRIPEGRYALTFTAIGYAPRTDSVTVRRDQTTALDVRLLERAGDIGETTVEGETVEPDAGVFVLDPRDAQNIPDPLGNDPLRSIKILPGVTSNNELSNAYSVRGGGYNENLYFLDGFEVYRPFRTSQGEQEGLGLINGDLASQITLYAGGFPARYGGKLASALDVTYARPTGPLRTSLYASLLDAGGMVSAGALGDRLGLAIAARRASASRLFGTQELEGVYDPDFQDVQGVVDVELAPGHQARAIGLLARHRFNFEPSQRRTTFGVFPSQLRTVAQSFTGSETDGYDVRFGGLRLQNRVTPALRAEHEASYFETDEFETLDVSGVVVVYEQDPTGRPDDPSSLIEQGRGAQRDVADNRIRVATLTGGGRYRLGLGRHAAEAGWQLRRLTFRDSLDESSFISGRDSAGARIEREFDAIRDAAEVRTGQASLWLEDAWDVLAEPGRLLVTGGARADYFRFNDEWTVSPRLQARYRTSDQTTLSGAVGVYYQAPTYRELRGEPAPGAVVIPEANRDVRSQRAALAVLGGEHVFARTRFVLRAEGYYKALSNLISYEVENTRVLYSGVNDSRGHAYGLDVQFRGEFVPGLESWLNYGFLVARERFLAPEGPMTPRDSLAFQFAGGGDLIARPTDRRHNVALFAQDHVPGDDSWTLHVRALYGTGTPLTPPTVAERIDGGTVFAPGQRAALRYPSYLRFDLGATKRAQLAALGGRPLNLLLTAEVLNVFDQTNTIAYAWVDDGEGFFRSVPTRLTPRTVNVRVRLDL